MAHMVSSFKKEGWRVSLNYAIPESGGPGFEESVKLLGLEGSPDDLSEDTLPSGSLSTYRQYLFYRRVMNGIKDSDIVIRVLGYPSLSTMSRAPYVYYVQSPWQARMRRFQRPRGSASRLYSVYLLPLRGPLLSSGKNAIFVANSQHVKRVTDEEWGASSAVIPPPVNVANFLPLSFRDKKRNKIVSIGRFSKEKNQLQQVEIAQALKKEGVDFSLVMIGNAFNEESKKIMGEILKRVEELGLAGTVKVMPNVGADVIRSELSDSAVFLHTCPVEGFGIVVAEAMSAGCIP